MRICIDSSSHTAVSSSQLIYSFMSSFFYLFSYFIVIATSFFFLQIDCLEPSFTDSVFRFRIRILYFSAAVKNANFGGLRKI